MTKTTTPEIIDQDRGQLLSTATMGVAAVGAASLLPSNPASAAVWRSHPALPFRSIGRAARRPAQAHQRHQMA